MFPLVYFFFTACFSSFIHSHPFFHFYLSSVAVPVLVVSLPLLFLFFICLAIVLVLYFPPLAISLAVHYECEKRCSGLLCERNGAGVTSNCGRCRASVWRLLFSQSGGRTRCTHARAHPRSQTTTATSKAVRAAWSCKDLGLAGTGFPSTDSTSVSITSPSYERFSRNMESKGSGLLLVAHFILICQQGKSCCGMYLVHTTPIMLFSRVHVQI